jgi:hypothetical protein
VLLGAAAYLCECSGVMMAKNSIVLGLLLIGSVLFVPGSHAGEKAKKSKAYPADLVEITFRSLAKNKVDLVFFSQTRSNKAWPGDGNVYNLYDSEDHDFSLKCVPNEKICWGAAVRMTDGNGYGAYWGVGIEDEHGCKSCCFRCGKRQPKETLED